MASQSVAAGWEASASTPPFSSESATEAQLFARTAFFARPTAKRRMPAYTSARVTWRSSISSAMVS